MKLSNYHFLKIPACESSTVLNILQNSFGSSSKTLNALTCQDFFLKKDRLEFAHMGVMLSSPETRLSNAYEQMHKDDEAAPSFKEFYTNPNRINFYSKLFNDIPLDKIGFIAFDTHPFKGLLLAEDWLKITIGRIPYDAFKDNTNIKISDDDKAIIQRLYADDFALYNRVKRIFNERWQKLLQKHQYAPDLSKKIVIHIGPPKTGTSAIQYALKEHQAALSSYGIWYPEHQLDGNNISSGNVDKLISHGHAGAPSYYDPKKAKSLIQAFAESHYNVLLLSSEHFFYYLPWLFAFFPNAQYIFYVRNPLAALESGFHQEIKRHKRTKAFTLPSKLSFQPLQLLAKTSREFSPDLTISYFDSKLFKHGSLIEDFVSLLPKKLRIAPSDQRINTQYCIEAIELMRFCNHFANDALLSRLDKFFQKYSQTQPVFSYISKDDCKAFEKELKQQVGALKVHLPQINSEKMYQIIDNYTPKEQVAVEQQEANFTDIIKEMKACDILLAAELSAAISANSMLPNPSLVKSLRLTGQEKILLTAKKLALKVRPLFSRSSE